MTLQKQISLFTEEELTYSPVDSHANPTQWQESEKERKMNAISGQKCLDAYEKFNRHGSWAKMFSGLLIGMTGWYSTRCKLTWKLKGTKYNRMYFQLHPSTLPIGETEYGLLLTPTTREEVQDLQKFKARMEKYPNGTTMPNLATQVFNQLLPTPTSVQRDHPERVEELKKTGAKTIYSRENGEKRPNSIIDYMNFHNMLPTPTASMAERGTERKLQVIDGEIQNISPKGVKFGINIRQLAEQGFLPKMLNTPTASDKNGGVTRPTEKLQYGTSLVNQMHGLTNGIPGTTSQLSPQFVLEMMGFPTDWTLLPFLNGETNQSKQEETQ